MFWRSGRAVATTAVAAALAVPAAASATPVAASATKLGPCTIGNPSSCTFHAPNSTVYCGTDRDRTHSRYYTGGDPAYRYYYFRGCRARIGAADIKCGEEADLPDIVEGRYYSLQGCLVTLNANRILVGCEASGFDGGGVFGQEYKTCGASPVITCDTYDAYRDIIGYDHATTCGRPPVVLRCVDYSRVGGPPVEEHYCELVIGPAASPVFSCRFDSVDRKAAVADVIGCLTGLPALPH
jgi:hypothetical protein